jgi:hypothetical protein
MIVVRTGTLLPDSEACSIALHIVNAVLMIRWEIPRKLRGLFISYKIL